MMKKFLMSVVVMLLCLFAIPATSADAAAAKLNKTSATIYEQKKVTLKVNNTNKKVTWKSANTKIATVNKGVVTGKKSGTTKVTAKVNGKTYTCKITVKKAQISASKVELRVGQTKKINLNGAYKKVTYKTSNSKVVTVSNGTIKAVGTGTATVTLTHNKKNYTCKVTVKEAVVTIKLDKTLFGTPEVMAELSKELKIVSKKTSGKYIVCTVTKKSYDKVMKDGRTEITTLTNKVVKSCPLISKITYRKDYKRMNIYVNFDGAANLDQIQDVKDFIDAEALAELMPTIVMYQCLEGTLVNDTDMKFNFFDASTNEFIIALSLRELK